MVCCVLASLSVCWLTNLFCGTDDHTRVVLKDVGPEVGADYINANYINGEARDRQKAYIACQGCLKATIPAFWQMMWEEDSRVIVMTTGVVERGKNKCAPYWPSDSEATVFGNYIVEPIG